MKLSEKFIRCTNERSHKKIEGNNLFVVSPQRIQHLKQFESATDHVNSMVVSVSLPFMAGMVMVVRSVFSRVVMIMYMGGACVGMLVAVLVQVLMRMNMGMLVRMLFAVVSMLMSVNMGMLVGMQMPMFVFSFHDLILLS